MVCVCAQGAGAQQASGAWEALAHDPAWLTLNYYHPSGEQYDSEIRNADFFLAEDGKTNPLHELAAFRQLMLEQPSTKRDELLCRFPARMTFLQANDATLKDFRRPVCAEYEAVNRPDQITSVSLLFASGYFDNPSSFYGHTMLKFNYGQTVADQSALDASLNYGANGTDAPSNPMYAIRGIFGGYDASYKRNNVFLNSHLYTNIEIRDLWEYELALTPQQRQFLVEHSWETLRASFDYYFFNDNCAHRIARLIEDATGQKFSITSGFWLLPTQVVRQLRPPDGTNFVAKETYIPSRKTLFSAAYAQLSDAQKETVIDYLQGDLPMQSQSVAQLDTGLLTLLLDYYDLGLARLKNMPKNAEKIATIHRHRAILLRERLARPVVSATSEAPPVAYHSLLDRRPPSLLRVDGGFNDDDALTRLSFRAANNDLLDTPITGQEVSRFLMGSAQVESRRGNVSLNRLTLIDILNLNTNPLPASLTNEFSWGLRVDYGRRNDFCDECRSAGVEGKVGKAFRANEHLLFYGLAGGRLHTEEQDVNSIANVVVEVGSVATISDDLVMQVEAIYTKDVTGPTDDFTAQFEARQQLTKRLGLRLNAATDGSQVQVTSGLALHFD